MKKEYIYAVIGLVVGLVLGYIVFTSHKTVVGGSSSTGAQNSAQRSALIVWAPTLATSTTNGSATTTSILNGDVNDRVIQSAHYACTGLTAVSNTNPSGTMTSLGLIISAATSSQGNVNSISNTNYILEPVGDTVATTTGTAYMASTSPGILGVAATGANNRIWAAGSYLLFSINATTTGTCTIGVNYLPL